MTERAVGVTGRVATCRQHFTDVTSRRGSLENNLCDRTIFSLTAADYGISTRVRKWPASHARGLMIKVELAFLQQRIFKLLVSSVPKTKREKNAPPHSCK